MPTEFADLMMRRPATADRPLEGQTVLVVEDSRFACEALRLLCQRSGARIRRADSIASARRHLQIYRPSIAIIDLGLPDGDGAELIASLSGASTRNSVIVGMSGDDGSEDRALAAGADVFLPKPIASLAAFQQTIAAAMPDGLPLDDRDEAITPDRLAVRDDLARIAAKLRTSEDDETLAYVVQFLAGVARSSGDMDLEEAVDDLARHRASCQPTERSIARVRALLHDRIGEIETFAA